MGSVSVESCGNNSLTAKNGRSLVLRSLCGQLFEYKRINVLKLRMGNLLAPRVSYISEHVPCFSYELIHLLHVVGLIGDAHVWKLHG